MRHTWVIPLIFLAAMMGVYLFTPEESRNRIRDRMKVLINELLIAELILIFPSLLAYVFWRQHWMRYVPWLLLIAAIVYCVRKIFEKSDEPPTADI